MFWYILTLSLLITRIFVIGNELKIKMYICDNDVISENIAPKFYKIASAQITIQIYESLFNTQRVLILIAERIRGRIGKGTI